MRRDYEHSLPLLVVTKPLVPRSIARQKMLPISNPTWKGPSCPDPQSHASIKHPRPELDDKVASVRAAMFPVSGVSIHPFFTGFSSM